MSASKLLIVILALCFTLPLQAQELKMDQPDPQITQQSRGGVENVLLSMLIPGLGEWRMGNKRAAKIFMGTEVVMWISYLSTRGYINVLQNDLEAFAASRAGVNTAGKGDQYWIDVGQAESIYAFNESKLLERDLNGRYEEGAGFDWQWQSEEDRTDYRQRRLDRLDWKRRSTFLAGGIVLNHLVSAVDVVRLLRKNRSSELSEERSSVLNFSYVPEQGAERMQLNFTVMF
ncbi:MAG: hypothetical protein AAFP70_20415 [Calditrichota bacterium]